MKFKAKSPTLKQQVIGLMLQLKKAQERGDCLLIIHQKQCAQIVELERQLASARKEGFVSFYTVQPA